VSEADEVKELSASLNRAMGWPEDTELELAMPDPLVEDVSLEEVSDKSFAANPDVVVAEQTVVKARAAYLRRTHPKIISFMGPGTVQQSTTVGAPLKHYRDCRGAICASAAVFLQSHHRGVQRLRAPTGSVRMARKRPQVWFASANHLEVIVEHKQIARHARLGIRGSLEHFHRTHIEEVAE
jgi:hypothetical protein